MKIESFAPVADDGTRVVILGSIPGVRSLELGEYYGHPQNRFWRVVAALVGEEVPTVYADKKTMALRHGIGLWDVAGRASRSGSLDSAIRDVEPNDVAGFIAAHTHLRIVAFNGRKAEALHDRHFDRTSGIEYISLPSTSPANAAFSLERLLEKWRDILMPCH